METLYNLKDWYEMIPVLWYQIRNKNENVMRVPGGWILEIQRDNFITHTFIPFNNEYMQ